MIAECQLNVSLVVLTVRPLKESLNSLENQTHHESGVVLHFYLTLYFLGTGLLHPLRCKLRSAILLSIFQHLAILTI